MINKSLAVLTFFAILLAGCSSSSDDFVFSGTGQADPGGQATVIVRHVLLRTVPASIESFRFTGRDATGQVVFGPQTVAKAPEISLQVSVRMTELTIEYLEGTTVVGFYQASVSLSPGSTVVLENLPWVSVAGALPNDLNFRVGPQTTVLGETLAAIEVEILDQFGNRFDIDGPVTLALSQNLNGAQLIGPTTVNAVAGLATFAGLSVNRAGTGYTLTANGAGLAPKLSQAFSIVVRALSGQLGLARLCRTGQSPTHVAAADFNGDGLLDLAVTNANSDTTSILLATAQGGFQPASVPSLFLSGDRPVVVLAGDLNGDTRQDLVVLHRSDNLFSVFFGNGDGTFQNPVQTNISGQVRGADLGDFNGDGALDLLVAYPFNSAAELFLNDGTGNFLGQGVFSPGSRPLHVSVGQLNPGVDSFLDAVVTNDQGNTVTVLLGDGIGGFSFSAFAVGSRPRNTAIADLNGDGHPDLVTTNLNSDTISISLGDGSGTFAVTSTMAVGDEPRWVGAADFNGDGDLDLAVAQRTEGSVRLLLGDGTGTFTPSGILAAGSEPVMLLPLDFNRDGEVDLVIAPEGANGIVLQPNLGGGVFPATNQLNPGVDTRFVISRDFNGDGRMDLITSEGTSDLAFYPGNGDGSFGTRTVVNSGGNRPQEMAVADFDGDGRTDVVLVNFESNNAVVFLNDGNGGFTQSVSLTSGGNRPFSVATGDFNGDGNSDFVVSHRDNPGLLRVFFGDGAGGFPNTLDLANLGSVVAVRVGDMNGDGRPDIVAASRFNNNDRFHVFLSDGAGAFPNVVTSEISLDDPRYLSIGDVNGDSHPDVALVRRDSDDIVQIFLGDGTGKLRFSSLVSSPFGNNWPPSHVVELVDLNGDGVSDLASADQNGYLHLALGSGLGTFQTAFEDDECYTLVGSHPFHLAVADFNGDGRPDFAVANHRPGGGGAFGGISIILQPPPAP